MCASSRDDRSLERIVRRRPLKCVWELHKEWTAPTHTRVLYMGFKCRIPLVKPLLNNKEHQKRLFWDEEKHNWSVAQWTKVLISEDFISNFASHLETKVSDSGGRMERQCPV